METWTKVNFGKYRRKTLPQILFKDPDWFFWAIKNNCFANNVALDQEATLLYKRASRVKIPNNEDGLYAIDVVLHPDDHFFWTMMKVKAEDPVHIGYAKFIRYNCLDMRIPRRFANYDKSGYSEFLYCFKLIVFDSYPYRMTKKRCEEFFEDKNNFLD